MIFGSSFVIIIDNEKTEVINQIKYLRVVLDSSLTVCNYVD